MERGKLLPTLGVGVNGIYANLMEKNETHGILYATLSVPISAWWGGSHAIRKARYNRQQAELVLQDTRQNLRLDIEHAWNSLVESYRQIDVARRNVISAQENLRQNNYWSGEMYFWNRFGIDEVTDYEKVLDSITTDDVRKAIADILKQKNQTRVIMYGETK